MPAPETCPNCGADVPRHAKACPECGSDESTGWSEDARAQSLGLPDENFDYEEFAQREFGPKPRRPHRQVFWWVVAVILLILSLLIFIPWR